MSTGPLDRIADLLGCSTQALSETDVSRDALLGLLGLWPDLTRDDHQTVLTLAQSLMLPAVTGRDAEPD